MISYTMLAAYFSKKMIRLVLLLSVPACSVAGLGIATVLEWSWSTLTSSLGSDDEEEEEDTAADDGSNSPDKKKVKPVKVEKKKKKRSGTDNPLDFFGAILKQIGAELDKIPGFKRLVSMFFIMMTVFGMWFFFNHAVRLAEHLSEPQIMMRGRSKGGSPVMIDVFREAYWWLRDKTPKDSRVMAWWDYGYQINGVGNRTSIAEGNTWNHEHIALLGKCLTSPEKVSHAIVRHLADYVLIWTTRWGGMYGDDLAKCPHMARIGGSVYHDIDPNSVYMDRDGKPSPRLRNSLLYRIHSWRFDPSVKKMDLYEEAYTTRNNMVRIFKVLKVSKKSKKWIAEHHTYPPAIQKIVAKKNDFKQFG